MPIPPGGYVGFAQMTPASRLALGMGQRATGSRRRKKRAQKSKRATSSTRRRAKSGRKMKFGSPAWQRKYKVGKFAKKRK